MKVKFSIVAGVIIALFVMPSCKKSETTTKQTIEKVVTLSASETYTFTLPDNQSDDPYQITSQATHFKQSDLTTDANGKTVYTYSYAANSENLLTDDITIANVEEAHPARNSNTPPPPPGKHKCTNMGNEVERTIHIHFVIQ